MNITQSPLRLSLSQSYVLRVGGITWNDAGTLSDPRQLFIPEFQLLSPDATTFATTWADGTWDTAPSAPTEGPFAVTVAVGSGQPSAVNPGVAGTYYLWIRFAGTTTPAFRMDRPIDLAGP